MALKAFYIRVRQSISQYIFNKRTLENKKRHELLKFLIENHPNKNEFSLVSLMWDIYSIKSFNHPDKEKLEKILELQLDSFVCSHEIERVSSGRYKLTGYAIISLEKYQLEDQRHKKSVFQQWILIIVTTLLIFVGLMQANIIKLPTLVDFTDITKTWCGIATQPHK